MKCIRGLSSVALVSFLSVNSGVAMSKGIEQVANPTLSAQTQPVVMANIFQTIQKVIQTGEQVNQIRLQEQRKQEAEQRRQELEAARREATEKRRLEAEQQRQFVKQVPVQSTENQDLYQRLARRSGEGHKAWYDRIDPIIQRVPGADYRAWKATLSSEDRKAYDVIVRQRNYEAAEIMNQVTPLIFKGVLQEEEESRQRQRKIDEMGW